MRKNKTIPALAWNGECLLLLDQRKLPHTEIIIKVTSLEECYLAIKDMIVRGAPLIGFTAIWGMVLWSKNNKSQCSKKFEEAALYLGKARPTAINLEYELKRCTEICKNYEETEGNLIGLIDRLMDFAKEQMELIYESNLSMAKTAESDLDKKLNLSHYNIMTLCNTGYLACGPMGTALGVIDHLQTHSKINRVYACETRPYLQGSRLTSYELKNLGIAHDIVVEGAMSYILGKGLVDAIFVGADRVAENGDVANKVGTSTLSIVAKYYDIPFYVVAPTSSFDLKVKNGKEIPIELRDEKEVLYIGEARIAPDDTTATNPSFDITEAKNISGIICEHGLISPVTRKTLLKIVNK